MIELTRLLKTGSKTGTVREIERSLVLAVSLAAGLHLPVGAQDALWRTYYGSAQNCYQHQDYPGAKAMLNQAEKAATQTDESLSTLYYLAHTCVKTNDLNEAERCYRTLLHELGTKTWAVLRPPDGTPDWEQPTADLEYTADGSRFLTVLSRRPPRLLTMRLAKPITIVDVLTDYGSLMQMQKRYDQAENAYRQAISLSDCRPDTAVSYESRILQKLAILYNVQGRTAEEQAVTRQLTADRNAAVPNYEELVNSTIGQLDHLRHHPRSLAIRLNNLALFCASHGDYSKAQALFERALSTLSDKPSKDKSEIVSNYADLLLAMGKVTEANSLAKSISGVLTNGELSSTATSTQP